MLFDQEVITTIRFAVVDRRPSVSFNKETLVKVMQKNLLFQSLSDQERNMLNNVDDKELRLSLEQFLIRCREEEKGMQDEHTREEI